MAEKVMKMLLLILIFMVGLLAQLIDGLLGMAYGVTSNTMLLLIGLPPYLASATIHQAEVFTTLASGLSHFKVGNVDKKLMIKLAIPGCIGGAIGAYLLVNLQIQIISLLVNIYLILMGGIIILRSFKINLVFRKISTPLLGAIGGLLDAMGGGGWGPIVTSTLIANGYNPKLSIGSVNLSEFFVTLVQSITFIFLIGFRNITLTIPLIVGGIIGAPIAAILCKKINTRILLILVGSLLIALNSLAVARWLYG